MLLHAMLLYAVHCYLHLVLVDNFVQNLPFDINNRMKLTLWFILYFGSGFAVPFIALRHHLLKS